MSKFSDRLLALGFASYADYLASDAWRSFRVRYKSSGSRMTCLICSAKPIQLHHNTYVRLGVEELGDVTPLCRHCHIAVHRWLKSSGRRFVEFTHEAVTALSGLTIVMPTNRDQERWNKHKRQCKDRPRSKADFIADREVAKATPQQSNKERRLLKQWNKAEKKHGKSKTKPRSAVPFRLNAKAEVSPDDSDFRRTRMQELLASAKKGGNKGPV